MLAVASVALFLSVLVWFNYSAVLPLVVEEWGLSGIRAGVVFGDGRSGVEADGPGRRRFHRARGT